MLPVFLVHSVCKMLYERLGQNKSVPHCFAAKDLMTPFALEHLNFLEPSHKTLNSFPFLLYFFHTFLKFLRRIPPRECTYSKSRKETNILKSSWIL